MSNLLPFTSPKSKDELFDRIRELAKKGWIEMPADSPRYGATNTGAPGNFLKDSLGFTKGGIAGWQVKYYTQRTGLITLFQKDPQPRAAILGFVKRFGITDALGRKSLRHTIRPESTTFEVADDAGNIIIRPANANGVVLSWTHETILNTATIKIPRLILVRGERKKQMVRFNRADSYENLRTARFIPGIVSGSIILEFNARESSAGSDVLRNHGTKFRIAPDDVSRFYANKEKVV